MNQTHPKFILTIASALISLLALIGCDKEDSVNPYMHDMHEGDEPTGEHHDTSTTTVVPADARRITITTTEYAFT